MYCLWETIEGYCGCGFGKCEDNPDCEEYEAPDYMNEEPEDWE